MSKTVLIITALSLVGCSMHPLEDPAPDEVGAGIGYGGTSSIEDAAANEAATNGSGVEITSTAVELPAMGGSVGQLLAETQEGNQETGSEEVSPGECLDHEMVEVPADSCIRIEGSFYHLAVYDECVTGITCSDMSQSRNLSLWRGWGSAERFIHFIPGCGSYSYTITPGPCQ